MAVLESRLVIAAADETGAAFASVQARIEKLQTQIGAIDAQVAAVNRVTPPPAAAPSPAETRSAEPGKVLPVGGGGVLENIASFAAMITGIAALAGGWRQAAGQAHEKVRMQLAGMSEQDIAEADKLAGEIGAKYPSLSQASLLGLARDIRAATGDYESAKKVLEPVAESRVVVGAAHPELDQRALDEQFAQLVKGIDIKGAAQDIEEFTRLVNGMTKGLNAFSDTIAPVDYYQLLKYARQAAPQLSDEFVIGVGPTLAQELRGSSGGRALADFSREMVGGRMSMISLKQLAALGLVDEKDLLTTSTGAIKGLAPGAHVQGWEELEHNPYRWSRDYLDRALTEHGITSPEERGAVITRILDQYAAQLGSLFLNQPQKIERDIGLVKGAMGTEGADLVTQADPGTAAKGAWNTLTQAIGRAMPVDFFTKFAADFAARPLQTLFPSLEAASRLPADIRADVGGWNALARQWIEIGPPDFSGVIGSRQSERDWDAEIAANHALWNAGYRYGDAAAEENRERSRGLALSGLPSNAPIDVTGKVELDPASKADVNVTVRIETDSLLKFIADAVAASSGNVAAHVGRMDTDAAPRRWPAHGH